MLAQGKLLLVAIMRSLFDALRELDDDVPAARPPSPKRQRVEREAVSVIDILRALDDDDDFCAFPAASSMAPSVQKSFESRGTQTDLSGPVRRCSPAECTVEVIVLD